MPRIDGLRRVKVLSVIAQQVLSIQQAIVQDLKTFEFDGKMIPLNKRFGVFITMNPGYAGRTEVRALAARVDSSNDSIILCLSLRRFLLSGTSSKRLHRVKGQNLCIVVRCLMASNIYRLRLARLPAARQPKGTIPTCGDDGTRLSPHR